MSDNGQKTPFGLSINNHTTKKATGLDNNQGRSLPVTIKEVGNNGLTLTLNFETGSDFTLPPITVPVNGTRYIRYPWAVGDRGYVLPGAVGIGNLSGLGPAGGSPFVNPANLAAMAFHPIGDTSQDPPDDPTAVQHNAPTGVVARDDNKKSQVKVHPTSGATIQGGGDGSGNYPHSSTASPSGVEHKSTTVVKTTAPTHQVSNDQIVGGNCNIAGALAAASAAIGGAMSFGGGGGGSDTSGNISVPTVRTSKPYTIGPGPNQLPPATMALQGARAMVIDAAAAPSFFGTPVGGGSQCCPVFCTGTFWVYA